MVRSLVPRGILAPRPLRRLENELENMFERFFRPEDGHWGEEELVPYAPPTNIAETETDFEVSVDLPGMERDDLKVEVKDGSLWIEGEKKEETEEQGKNFHRVERRYGHFRRIIPLPTTVEEGRIEAELTHGVLRVKIPKTEEAKPKLVEIKVSE